jgi:hypothetical protein
MVPAQARGRNDFLGRSHDGKTLRSFGVLLWLCFGCSRSAGGLWRTAGSDATAQHPPYRQGQSLRADARRDLKKQKAPEGAFFSGDFA